MLKGEDTVTVGERIQHYRKQQGLSQEELGQKLLVSRQTISLWENDQTLPTIDNLIRLKEIFGVSLDELLCEQKEELAPVPLEQYVFTYTAEDVRQRHKLDLMQRAKKMLICVGKEEVWDEMAANDRKTLRYTMLREYLCDGAERSDRFVF